MIGSLVTVTASLPLLTLVLAVMVCFLCLSYNKTRHVPMLSLLSIFLMCCAYALSLWWQPDSEDAAPFGQRMSQVVALTPHLVIDGFARLNTLVVVVSGIISVLFIKQKWDRHGTMDDGEADSQQQIMQTSRSLAVQCVSVLIMMIGAWIAIAANGTVGLFLGIEILALGTMGLVMFCSNAFFSDGTDSDGADVRSQTLVPLVKALFLRQAVSSCLLLFGFGLLFAHSGSVTYTDINRALLYDTANPLLLLGAVIVLFSLCYQLAFVPMHAWFRRLQDATDMSVWMPVIGIAQFAIFVALLRFLMATAVPAVTSITSLLTGVMVLGLVVSCIRTLSATHIKDTVSAMVMVHMLFVFIVMLSLGQQSVVVANVLVLSMMLGIFLVSMALYQLESLSVDYPIVSSQEHTHSPSPMSSLRGCYRHSPQQALLLSMGLLVLAGLPLTVGFVSKLFTLMATVQGLDMRLTALAVIVSVVIWYAVFKRVREFFDASSNHDDVKPASQMKHRSYAMKFVLVCILLIVVGTGVYPEPMIVLAKLASMG